MTVFCEKCGKKADGEGIIFCPYCGEKLNQQKTQQETSADPEVGQWITKALQQDTIQKRKKILAEAAARFPGNRDIEREMLFVGEPVKSRRDGDYFLIKSYLLQLYRTPGEFPEPQRCEMRRELLDSPALNRYLGGEEDPEAAKGKYLRRLCGEYLALFLEGDNRIMGNIFGFHVERKKEKLLAKPVSEMIRRMESDEQLAPDQRKMLRDAMYSAFSGRYDGKTEFLDKLLQQDV